VVCADTSCWIAYLAGDPGEDTDILEQALKHRIVVMAPVVLTELVSAPGLSIEDGMDLMTIRLLTPKAGFWWRAGKLRSVLLGKGHRPKTADVLIAQSCLDYQAELVTRDRDFRPFAEHAGLVLP